MDKGEARSAQKDAQKTGLREGMPRRATCASALSAAAGAALVAVLVGALLAVDYVRDRDADPMNSTELAALRLQAAKDPKNQDLVERIRGLDLELREEYFRHVRRVRLGNWLLLGCVAVFVVAGRVAMAQRSDVRPPRGKAADVEREMRFAARGRRAVVALSVLLAAGAVSPLAVQAYIRLTTVPPPPPHAADPADIARYWPGFRGPGGLGVSAYANVPTEWDGNSGRNILWKAPVPLPGKSSPIVWADRIFLTGATHDKRAVYCFDAATGKMLWSRPVENVPGSPASPRKAFEDTGYAASTPVADDRHVFAIFANGDLACFRHDGTPVWAKGLGQPNNQYSHGSSLVMFRNLLLVQWDQGALEDYMSKLLAFDGQTGRLAWQQRRPVASSWSTPAVMTGGARPQLITSANPWVMACDPASGAELWRAKCMEGGDVASSPVWAGGFVYAVCAETKLWAIRANGSGDVTATKQLVWSGEYGLPDITSPVTDGKHVWLIDSGGLLVCYDARTGEKAYEHELEKVFNASPAIAGDRLYLVSMKGLTFIAQTGGQFKLLRTNPLGEAGVYASPAFQDGRIYLRAKKHLFCIGEKQQSASAPASEK